MKVRIKHVASNNNVDARCWYKHLGGFVLEVGTRTTTMFGKEVYSLIGDNLHFSGYIKAEYVELLDAHDCTACGKQHKP